MKKRNSLIYLVLILVTAFAYRNLAKTFFQQDEWQFFGAVIYSVLSKNLLDVILPFGGQLTHFYPLANFYYLIQYLFFKVNFAPYAYLSILLHFLNGVLVYILISKFSKNRWISSTTAILFLVNSISHQAVTWVLASVGSLPATAFFLGSLIFLVDYLKNLKSKYFLASAILFITSILFKEITIFWLIFVPTIIAIHLKNFKKPAAILLAVGGLYLALRLFFLFSGPRSAQPEIGDVSTAPISVYLGRLVTVPLKGISQSFIPTNLLIKLSNGVAKTFYPSKLNPDGSANDVFAQTTVFALVSIFLSVLIISGTFLVSRELSKKGEKRLADISLVAVLFLFLSLLPYVFIPGKAGYFTIFETRNLYIPGIAASFLLVNFIYRLKRPLFVSLISLMIISHFTKLTSDVRSLEKVGQLRKSFLATIQSSYPDLPDNVIIYAQSDRPYYGMPENEKILPVQSGFGRMVLVWYQDFEKFPACLYEEQFLHDLLSQGYKFCQGRGFGYFRDDDKLLTELEKQKINPPYLIGFDWNGETQEFREITHQLKN